MRFVLHGLLLVISEWHGRVSNELQDSVHNRRNQRQDVRLEELDPEPLARVTESISDDRLGQDHAAPQQLRYFEVETGQDQHPVHVPTHPAGQKTWLYSLTSGSDIGNLFTDGSFFASTRQETSTAAWGVYFKDSHMPLASGPLVGLPQSIGRAELTAFLRALQWVQYWPCRTHIWVDALFVQRGFSRHLEGYRTCFGDSN